MTPTNRILPAAFVAMLWLMMIAGLSTVLAQDGPQRLPESPLVIDRAGAGALNFTVELADSREERAIGMMFRDRIAPDEGMLFHYDEPRPISMWMKNTYVPLDILFIRPDGVIANIKAYAMPLTLDSIASDGEVNHVLELKGGIAAEAGIKPGDVVRHEAIGNLDMTD